MFNINTSFHHSYQKARDCKKLVETDAHWLENTLELALESWKFYPVFCLLSISTSANLPLDRTLIYTASSHLMTGRS